MYIPIFRLDVLIEKNELQASSEESFTYNFKTKNYNFNIAIVVLTQIRS